VHWGAFSDLGCKIYTQQLCRHDIADQQVSEVCMRRTCKASRGSVKGASRNPLFVNDRKGQSEPRLVVHDECHWLSASKQHDSPTAQRRQTRRPKLSSPLAFPEGGALYATPPLCPMQYTSARFLRRAKQPRANRPSSTRPRERILVVDDERIIAAVRPVSGCFGIDSNWRGFSRKSLCSRGGDQ